MKKWILPMVLLVLAILLMPTTLAEGNVKINDFSSNVTNGTVILYTRFNGSVTGNITDWKFIYTNVVTGNTTYSGGTGSENITVHHNIKKPGVYNVTFVAWGPEGNDTLTKVAYVTANPGHSNIPVADFNASSTYGSAPLNVSFTDNSTGATSWYWKFGDGNISKQRNPTHNYSTEGNYTVILAVNNANGWGAKTQEITVQNGTANLMEENIASEDVSSSDSSSSDSSSGGGSSFGSATIVSSNSSSTSTTSVSGTDNVIKVVNETDNAATVVNGTDNVTTVMNGTDNVATVVNGTDNTTQVVNATQSGSNNTQGLEQNNSSIVANATQMPEQTQSANTSSENNSSANTSGNEGNKTPAFEMIYGIVGLVGASLYRRK